MNKNVSGTQADVPQLRTDQHLAAPHQLVQVHHLSQDLSWRLTIFSFKNKPLILIKVSAL